MAKKTEQKPKQPQISIEVGEEVAEGVYSNLAIISHSQNEFVVDFIRMIPNAPKAKVKSRIILTPEHAKRFTRALVENIKRFEAQHGSIADQKQPPYPNMNFNTPTGEA